MTQPTENVQTPPAKNIQTQRARSFIAGIGLVALAMLLIVSEVFTTSGSTGFLLAAAALFLFGMAVGWRWPDGFKGLAAAAAGVLIVATLMTSDLAWVGLVWIMASLPMLPVGLGWLVGCVVRKSQR